MEREERCEFAVNKEHSEVYGDTVRWTVNDLLHNNILFSSLLLRNSDFKVMEVNGTTEWAVSGGWLIRTATRLALHEENVSALEPTPRLTNKRSTRTSFDFLFTCARVLIVRINLFPFLAPTIKILSLKKKDVKSKRHDWMNLT